MEHLYPAGARRGTTNIITAIGKQDPWPVEVWTDSNDIQLLPEKDKGKFRVVVSDKANPGPRLVRLYNAEGASTVRYFMVSDQEETEEKEPNEEFARPQVFEKLPIIVNGRLEKNGDVDSYAVSLQAGQWLVASLDAYVLASTMDGLLRITDTNGVQLAFNHDGNRSLDPFLTWQAPAVGTYVVQVMGFPYPANSSINFDGGSGNIYRLTLTTGPYLGHTFPTGVARTNHAAIEVCGWNLPGGGNSSKLALNTASLPPGEIATPVRQQALNVLHIPVSTLPEQQEQETNNTVAEAQSLLVPGHLSGRIQSAGDIDRFLFETKKGEKWEISIQSARLGFPLDATLRIEDSTGKELAKNDDANNSADPTLNWTAPSDGKFLAVVSSLLRQGGSNFIYRLSLTHPTPAARVTVSANHFNVGPGKTNEFKATLTRSHGHDRALEISAVGLPPGVSLLVGDIPAKTGDITLKLIGQADAKPFSGKFFIQVKDGGSTFNAPHEFISRSVDNGVPQGYTTLVVEKVDALWLTVLK